MPLDLRRRGGHASVDNILAASVAVLAGGSSRWLFDAPLVLLTVFAVGAAVVVIAAPRASPFLVIVSATASAFALHLPQPSVDNLANGFTLGLLTSLCLAGPLAVAGVIRQRRAFQRRGWDLAAAEADRRTTEVQAALQRERMALAAEMHDGLGHALTLIAVRLGQLSLDAELADKARNEVADIRHAAADAADELGVVVRLLRQPTAVELMTVSVEDVIAKARDAGVRVISELPADLRDYVNTEVATAVARVTQEALTNAAKHAPSSPVTISAELTATDVVVTARNPLGSNPGEQSTSGGFGLVGLRHRATVLGGSLSPQQSPSEFTLTLRLPRNAKPSAPTADLDDGQIVRAQEDEAHADRVRAVRLAVAVPAALVSAMLFVALAYFVLSNVFSVMSPENFSRITAGDSRSAVETQLPRIEILDPPRESFPARDSEECRYYEAAISIFERLDVFVICFDSNSVTRTGTVPAQ